MRGIHDENICRMEKMLKEKLAEICSKRALRYDLKKTDEKKPVILDRQMIDDLAEAAGREGISWMKLPSGAGHDAMSFASICPTGMIFIPCRDGISHNIREHTEYGQIATGIRTVLSYILHSS